MLRLGNILLHWQLAYTSNFALDYRKTWRAYCHAPGTQYLPGTMYLLYPLSCTLPAGSALTSMLLMIKQTRV